MATETVEVERGALRQALTYHDKAIAEITAVTDYEAVKYIEAATAALEEYAAEDVDDD